MNRNDYQFSSSEPARERQNDAAEHSGSIRGSGIEAGGYLRSVLLQDPAIFFTALIVRLLYLWQLRGSPMFDVLIGDGRGYDLWAREIAGGNWIGDNVFYQAPLYPYFLAVIYRIAGFEPIAVRCAQVVMGAAACVMLAHAGRRFISRRAGVAAGTILALYAPAIYFDGLVQKASLGAFLLCLLLWILSETTVRSNRWLFGAAGVVLGLLAVTRENALILVAAIFPWILVYGRPSAVRGGLRAGCFALGMLMILMPVATRNASVGGGFYLTTSQFGPNFYIGNHAGTDGRYQPLRTGRGDPRYERDDAIELAEAATGRKLGPAEVSSYWTNRAIEYIRERPADWMRLMLHKVFLLFNATELNDTEDQYTYADHAWILRVLGTFAHFGVIAPVAVIGIAAAWDARRRLSIIYLILGLYSASVVAFFVFGRYRYPLVPPLILLAGAGLTGGAGWFRNARPMERAVVLAATAILAIFANLPTISRASMRATTYTNLGVAYADRGDTQEAVTMFEHALAYDPASPSGFYNLANSLRKAGRKDEALEYYRQAAETDPTFAMTQYNWGLTLQELGRTADAMSHYETAIQLDPMLTDAYNNLGIALASEGHLDSAIGAFKRALEITPESVAARQNFQRALQLQAAPAGNR